MVEVRLFPLVPRAALPIPAPARTRDRVPPGYGVQEQCLPFTAAASLGLLIPSPISFGLCRPSEVPAGSHPFRSPLDRPREDGIYPDPRVFYVTDDPGCRFALNAFTFEGVPLPGTRGVRKLEPGISFFERPDQLDLFKLHLPYIWRTPPESDVLILPPLNRESCTLSVLAGLVETDWYGHPINLVLRVPPLDRSIHVAVNEPVAQAVFIPRASRMANTVTVPTHAREARAFLDALGDWYRRKSEDRSAYRRLARSHHGRLMTQAGEQGLGREVADDQVND